ncbi:MAG TPA: glycerophosphodiester phosphodiesterase family protein [Caulobacteraceae bacterium]|nr:glycerophosphodiester phosphodiesterase family protein [Caulobacteraceae bacterium]
MAPAQARAEAPAQPLIVAEAGSAERPQDSASAFQIAIDQGCDFLQANLVATRDGAFAVRRDNELSATTDVATRPEFAARRTTKAIDDVLLTGWFAEDFTLAELKTLKCREAWPRLRPQSARFDGQDRVLSLEEVLAIARAGCVKTARTIGVFPRILHGRYYAGLGLEVEDRLARLLTVAGYQARAAAVWVQAFEAASLEAFGRGSPLRRMQVIAAAQDEAQGPLSPLTTPAGLAAARAYADAICVDPSLVIDPDAAVFPAPTTLVLDARAAGLQLFAGTVRAENQFLPGALRRGDPASASFPARQGDAGKLLVALFAGGVDGVATDQPGMAARARSAAIRALERRRTGF